MDVGLTSFAHQLREWTVEFRNRHALDVRKLYREWEKAHLRRLLRHYSVDCIFDVGANNGQYAQMVLHDVGFDGLVISFEPNPAAAAVLRKKARGRHDWLIEKVALGPSDGTAMFNVMHGSEFSSLSTPRHDEVSIFKETNRVDKNVMVRTETLATARAA